MGNENKNDDQTAAREASLSAQAGSAEVGPNEYQCSMCNGVFEKGWSDEEAQAEHDRDFPGQSMETSAVVCDDCYQKVCPATHPVQYAEYFRNLFEQNT